MALQMTLAKDKNTMYFDFPNAYWVIEDLNYTTTAVVFRLNVYPNRESKLMQNHVLENPSVGFGGAMNVVSSRLYTWQAVTEITNIFPSGIPLSVNEQKTAIYEWIKSYTELPFIDVLEEQKIN